MTILQRVEAPTPRFFKKVRNTGFVLGTIGASLLTNSAGLSPAVLKIAQFLTIAGVVATAISQVTTTADNAETNQGNKTGTGN